MARAWLESVIAPPGHRWLPPETDTSHALATKRAGPELVLRSETSDTVNRHICRCRQRLKSSPPDSGLPPRMAGRLQHITPGPRNPPPPGALHRAIAQHYGKTHPTSNRR